MELTKRNFTVLYEYLKNPYASQREVAERTGLSLGSVNAANKELTNEGLLESDSLTDSGYEALHPYKVENAVILAAGLSSRFAPISYEKPKGLLKVRGEILIERQIRQLQDAGISNITVVVGYKKEYFFYLESKFGVSIVVNNEYASKNNHASLMCVKERLCNTYICSSDDYLLNNPFEAYVWKAFYSAQYAEGATKEWCIQTGAMDRITNVTIGGSDAWYMLGHVYFDKAFSLAFKQILETEYNKPETTDKLWEDLYIEHIKELDMVIKKYPEGEINEFDSLDELRAFDPHFIENVDSDIFDNIEQVLGCSKSEIHDVYPLKQGLTNLSCHFRTNDGEYVYRHPGVGTELLINRNGEVAALKKAKELGLDDTFIHEDPKRGWKISKFVPNAKQPDPHDAAQMNRMMQMCRSLHESGANVETEFDFYLEAKRYESLLLEKGPIDIPGYREMAAEVDELEHFVQADNAPKCLCHNDFFYLNFLIDENDKYYLIDWEYAGMCDPLIDLSMCAIYSYYDEAATEKLMQIYFGREPETEERKIVYSYIALGGFLWALWAVYKASLGEEFGEYTLIMYRYAKTYYKKVCLL